MKKKFFHKEKKRSWCLIWVFFFLCWICLRSMNTPILFQFQHYSNEAQDTTFLALSPSISRPPEELETIHDNHSIFHTEIAPRKGCFEKCEVQKQCATVEEMGRESVSNSIDTDLRIRKLILEYQAQHGAQHVKTLPAQEFCKRGFVFGKSQEDGFGNEMYKVLTAAGLALMLNRSLIIGEHSSTNPAYLGLSGDIRLPFGDYVTYSDESFSMRELKHLWVIHGCVKKYKRPLNMRVDTIQKPSATNSLCKDWTKWTDPILWFTGAQDAVALQFFLKNVNPNMRSIATAILGDPSNAATRTNIFGELMRILVLPTPAIKDAVNWALAKGTDPDIALHLRMRNSRSKTAIDSSCKCLHKIMDSFAINNSRKPRVVVVTDTPAMLSYARKNLQLFSEVIVFDYQAYIDATENVSNVMSRNYFQPPKRRARDWGPLPRWVAIVDFFLASRATLAVVSAGSKRVATTYVQLIASLAAAHNLAEEKPSNFAFYSNFQAPLLITGLSLQSGWGHTWRTFGGRLSCRRQGNQCALTPLLPFAWWDTKWQSPVPRDFRKIRAFGIYLNATTGSVRDVELAKFCRSRRKINHNIMRLSLPSCQKLNCNS